MWQSNKGAVDTTPAPAGDVSPADSADLDALDKDLDSANIDVGANAVNSVQ